MVLSYEKSQGASLASATPRSWKGTEGGVLSGYGQSVREGYRARSEDGFAESLGKSYSWAVGFLSCNTGLSQELWTVITGISGFDD